MSVTNGQPEGLRYKAPELATLGGGCFWCLDAAFRHVRGVLRVTSGYCGGKLAAPSYEQVCSGATGHAEVVQVEFDPAQLSYVELLEMFFALHDPTTQNRQGHDVGTQYRSVVFCHSAEQRAEALGKIAALNGAGIWPSPIVTEVKDLAPFFAAEHYHQDYFSQNPAQGYCSVVIAPKLAKFRKAYASSLR